MMLAAFAHPVFDSQRTFRELLQATARPAVPRTLPVLPPTPDAAPPAAMAILLSLCDSATTLWLQQPDRALVEHLRFHTGTRLVTDPAEADFALITDTHHMPPLDAFATGDLRYPDRSATLLVPVEAFQPGTGRRFSGPGIESVARLQLDGPSPSLWAQRAALEARRPCGVDLMFVCGHDVVALPRSTRVEEA
jgi:alpha-D-ribose 1-methylphosphonate 5-triphosphate synthase subunit PhnH